MTNNFSTRTTFSSPLSEMNTTVGSSSLLWSGSSQWYITSTLTPNISTLYPKLEENINDGYTTAELILIFLFSSIFMVGTVGNALIFYYFGIKKHSNRSVPELLFCCLSIFDFGASILNPTLYIYWMFTNFHWHMGYWACKFLLPLGPIATTSSGGIFTIIAFDRQRTIVHPFKHHYKIQHIKLCVVGVLLYAFLMNFHYGFNISINDCHQCMVADVSASSYSVPTIITFLIQDFTLIFVFAFTNWRIFSHLKSTNSALTLGVNWEKRKRDNSKVIRLLVVLATVFFVLTLPRDIFHLAHIISWFDGQNGIRVTKLTLQINSSFKVLHTANSCVNVFIYHRMHRGFQIFINRLFCFWKDFNKDRKYSISAMTESFMNKYSSPRKHESYSRATSLDHQDGIPVGRKRADTVDDKLLRNSNLDLQ